MNDLLDYFEFSTPLVESAQIVCPRCTVPSAVGRWGVYESGPCDSCSTDHPVMRCPECDEIYDSIWSPIFEVRYGETTC